MRRAVIACVMLATTRAHADDELAEARRLESALEYERALVVVERALAHGGAEPARVAELHLLAGRLAAGLDNTAVAEDHFARTLALRPETRLAEGTSPKLTAPFDAARARGVPALVVTARVVRGLVTIAPQADPLGLVVGVQVHLESRGNHFDVTERGSLRVVVPADATPVEVAALDATGNRVWVGPAGQVAEPDTGVGDPRRAGDPRGVRSDTVESRSIVLRWQSWVIAGGAVAIAGGVFAWRSSSAQDEWNRLRGEDGQHDFSSLQAIEDRGRRDAIVADIAFGVAGAAALTAAILAVVGRDDSRIGSRVVVGVGAISVAGRF